MIEFAEEIVPPDETPSLEKRVNELQALVAGCIANLERIAEQQAIVARILANLTAEKQASVREMPSA